MPIAAKIVPQELVSDSQKLKLVSDSQKLKPNGRSGRLGPDRECGSTSLDLGARSSETLRSKKPLLYAGTLEPSSWGYPDKTHQRSCSAADDLPFANDAPRRPSDDGISTCLLLTDNAKDWNQRGPRRYYCQRSRFTLAGPGLDPGSTALLHAPCKSNKCPYCGRRNMYHKRNRIYDRLEQDRVSKLSEKTSYEFVTTTFRVDAFTPEQAFEWIKPMMSYAIRQVRRPRAFNKRYRRSAWSGCDLEYVNDVDVTPTSSMPHIHALYSVRFSGVKKLSEGARARYCRRMAKELHYYANNWLRRRLGQETLRWREGESYPYTASESLAYVHFSGARSTQNCVMYMALHNGKIWTDGREYPVRYRRFAASRGYLPKVEVKEASRFSFVHAHLKQIALDLVDQGIIVTAEDLAQDGAILGAVASADFDSYRIGQALGRYRSTKHSEPVPLPERLPLAANVVAFDEEYSGLRHLMQSEQSCVSELPAIGDPVALEDDQFGHTDPRLLALERDWPNLSLDELRNLLAISERSAQIRMRREKPPTPTCRLGGFSRRSGKEVSERC